MRIANSSCEMPAWNNDRCGATIPIFGGCLTQRTAIPSPVAHRGRVPPGDVPERHLLRSIDRFVELDGLRRELAPYYSATGRPSVDPELMIRMLIVGYCFGIRSERRLCEEVHLNLAYRWFCRLGLDGGVPDHSTFSKNRHGGFVTVTSVGLEGEKSESDLTLLCDGGLPLRCRLGSEDPQRRSGDEMALKVEIIVNGGLHAQKVLGRSG
jgi:hypothetical protein